MNLFQIPKTTLVILTAAWMIGCSTSEKDLSYSKPGHQFYEELPNPAKTPQEEWAKVKDAVNVSFVSDNERYAREKVPAVQISRAWQTPAWKGEKVHTQILVWTKEQIPELSFRVQDLVNDKGDIIPAANIEAAFIRYTMADNFGGGCADRDLSEDDSSLVADPIDIITRMPVETNSVRPVWLSISVPREIPAGKYAGTLVVKAGNEYNLAIAVDVSDHVLPAPSEWAFDFDMWQYPAPIARMHDVPLWSDAHYALMKQYYTILANAGQKVITANIIEQPWGLDHVHFDDPSLVKWTKKTDGSWEYDFSQFDKYISFVMSCGITGRINCYTMITWDLSFIYHDEASGENKSVTLDPGSAEYNAFWSGMLTEFTSHLKEKGWYNKTAIAMDERPVESMQAIIGLLKSIDPEWKIALAGDEYHPEIENDIYDYCLASYLRFDDDVMARRIDAGKPTTFYTACVEEYPNGYTFSPPAENTFLAWHAAAKGYTGYLFWAYNTWVANPLKDSRWKRYPAGELFQFYPGPRTSIRFEKLVEGIMDYEKIRILREEFSKTGNIEGLTDLDRALSLIRIEDLGSIPAAEMVEHAQDILNQL